MNLRQLRRSKETALKARDIVRNTFDTDRRTSKYVVVAGSKDTPRGWRITTLTKEKGKRARAHAVQVQVPRGYQGKFRACPDVKIDCDCLSGNTMVLTDQGWRRIFSIAADWQPGDPLTVNYVVDGKVYKGSTPFYKGMQPTWLVKLSNGSSFKATRDHKILLTRNDGNYQWKRFWKTTGNLDVGDKVVVTNNSSMLPAMTRSVAFKEAYFLGFWYGDGSFCSPVLPDLQVPEGRKRKSMKRIIDLGIVKEEVPMTNGTVRLKFNIKAVELMARFGVTPLTRHRVPPAILEDPQLLLGFLSGLLDADGGNVAGGGMSIGGSKELSVVKDALVRFGVAHVQFKEPREGSSNAKGSRTNLGERNRDLCNLRLAPQAFRVLGDRLWLVRKPKLRENSRDKKPYAKVVSVSYAGRDHVYDIYVDRIHRFVADTAVVHNCSRHLFVWNYALGVHGAALRDRTNGQAPVETNPDEKPGCCIDGEAWVHTEFGSTKMKDVRPGDRVLTLDGLRRVTESVDMGIRDCLAITTTSDRILRCTPDHVIRVATDRGISDVSADQLDDSMYVIVGAHAPRQTRYASLPTPEISAGSGATILPRRVPQKLTPDVAEFLGLFVAEGSGGSQGCAIAQYEPVTRARAIALCKKLWCRPNKNALVLGKDVSDVIKEWGITFGSYNKTIPDVVMQSDNRILASFLRGYYAGDGWFSRGGKYSTAGTCSWRLRDDLMYALLRFGIPARNTTGRSGHKSTIMHCVRTSDYRDTAKAIENFLPDRCFYTYPVEAGDRYIYSKGSNASRVPYRALRSTLVKFAGRVINSRTGNDDLIPIRDLSESFPGIRIRKLLQRSNLVTYRTRESVPGGKPQQLSTLNAALRVTRKIRIRAFYRRFLRIRHSGDTVNRDKVERMVAQVPAKYVDDLRDALSVFLRDDVFFERVRAITETRPRRVYDIGVEGTPYFFADGFYVHNCKHSLVALKSLIAVNPSFPERRVTATTHARVGKAVNLTTLRQALKR